jgi:integrase
LLGCVPRHPSGLLFSSPRDRMWTQPSHHRYWSLLRRFAGHPGFDFYELRRAAATMLLERGDTPSDVAHQLGHAHLPADDVLKRSRPRTRCCRG